MLAEYFPEVVLFVLAVIMFKVEAYAVAWMLVLAASLIFAFADDLAARRADWDRKQQEQRVADARPRPVSRSDDGCVVYAFKPQDRWLYFTRCAGAQTSTTNVHQVCSGGKTRHCKDVHTNIETTNDKEQGK